MDSKQKKQLVKLSLLFLIVLFYSCKPNQSPVINSYFMIDHKIQKNLTIINSKFQSLDTASIDKTIDSNFIALITYISDLRTSLYEIDCKTCSSIKALNNPLDTKAASDYLIGKEIIDSRGEKLSNKVGSFYNPLLQYIQDEKLKGNIDRKIGLWMNQDFVPHHAWEVWHFRDIPMAACIIFLDQLELDIKEAYYEVIKNNAR